MTLRVLHIITSLTRGGAESMLVRLLDAMDKARFENRVLCLGPGGPLVAELEGQGVRTLCLGLGRSPRSLLCLPGCLELAAWAPQVLQGWMYHGNLAASLLRKTLPERPALAWNIRCGLDTPASFRPSTRLVIHLGARFSPYTDRVLYNSTAAMAQHEAAGYAPERSLWIPNGFDLGRFHPDPAARSSVRNELGISSETPLLGHFARCHPEKNQALFLEALASLPADVHGVLAGQGIHADQPLLASSIERLGISDRVHLLGERTDLPRLTAALDVAVSPSWNEGFSNTLGEALACGVPCVATRVGDSECLVQAAGRTVPPGDATAMANALQELLALPPPARNALGQLGRQRMEATFGLGAVARQYESLYESLNDRC